MKNLPFFLLVCFICSGCDNEPTVKKESTSIEHFTQLDLKKVHVKKIVDLNCQLGEGAVWNYQTDELFFIDIEGRKFHVFTPANDSLQTYNLEQRIGTVVPTADDEKVILALDDGIHELSRSDHSLKVISNPEPNRPDMRMNDGKCDPAGRLWVGSMALEQTPGAAALYKINSDGSFEEMVPDVTISNGIAWSIDEKTMYYIDTPTGKVKAYSYDKTTGAITYLRDAVNIPESLGFPDGMTIDAEGMLWIALWNGNSVTRWDPNTGKLLNKVQMPAHNITSCAFGGPDLATLYVTSAREDMTEEELTKWPDAGDVFSFRPGVKGIKANLFDNQ